MMGNESSQSEETNNSVDEELNNIEKILQEHIARETPRPSKKNSFRQMLAIVSIFWSSLISDIWQNFSIGERRFLYGAAASFLLASVFNYISKPLVYRLFTNTKAEDVNNYVWLLRLLLTSILCYVLYFVCLVSFVALNITRSLNGSNQLILNTLGRVKDKAKDEQKLVKELSRFSQQSLKSFEEQISLHLKVVELREKITSDLLPLIAIGAVVFYIYILNIPIQSLGNNLFFGAVAGVSVLAAALVLPLLKFVLNSSKLTLITPFERCLALLKQARDIKSNTEANE